MKVTLRRSKMFPPESVLITGANRGLGLEFVRQMLENSSPPKLLFATCRNPDIAEELKNLAKTNSNLHILKLNVDDVTDIERVRLEVESLLKDRGLNLLINNAAIAYRMSLDDVTADRLNQLLHTNVTGPIMVTKTFFPLLKKAASQSEDKSLNTSRAAVINVTSNLGSIEENTTGGLHGYRPSKAALNMFTKNLSIELREYGILAVALHPGWVRTDMGGPDAWMSKEESIRESLNVLAGLTEETNGKMISYDGQIVPW